MYKTEKSVDMENTPDSAQKIELKQPSEIYKQIKKELEKIINNLQKNPLGEGNTTSTDLEKSDIEKLRKQSTQALTLLENQKEELDKQLDELDKNAERDTFTIAFYGDGSAAKAMLVETLRTLLKEPTKVKQQQAFQQAEKACLSAEEGLQELRKSLEQAKETVNKLEDQRTAELQIHDEKHSQALSAVTELQKAIIQRQKTSSPCQKPISLFAKQEEEIQLSNAQDELQRINAANDAATSRFGSELSESLRKKGTIEKNIKNLQLDLSNDYVAMCRQSEAVGSLNPDPTMGETLHYNFNLNGKVFNLLDIPCIADRKDAVDVKTLHNLKKANLVFYITERILLFDFQTSEFASEISNKTKGRLGEDIDLWVVNHEKCITGRDGDKFRPITNPCNEKKFRLMHEKIGGNFRGLLSVDIKQAYLASTENFLSDSLAKIGEREPMSSELRTICSKIQAEYRNQIHQNFNTQELIKASQIKYFIRLLCTELIENSGYKISQYKADKSRIFLQKVASELIDLEKTLEGRCKKSEHTENSPYIHLSSNIKTLKSKLEDNIEKLRNQLSTKRIQQEKPLQNNQKTKDFLSSIEAEIDREVSKLKKNMQKKQEEFQKKR